ncbi:MAG: ABC transporter ATP-binding protein [archaeon]
MIPPAHSGGGDERNEASGSTSAGDRPVRIRIDGLRKEYSSHNGGVLALEDVSLAVRDREFLCLLGPSGCGKSTFLRLVSGLLEPDAGSIDIDADPDADRPTTSMVFQEGGIFPWKSVLENVAFGLKMRGVDRERRHEIAHRYIEKVNLGGFADAYPHQLSGGMKQRVGIARAFANDPAILLMDEPFGDLDAQTKRLLQEELIGLWNESRKTVVYVTHDIEEAILLGDRLGVMSARPGRIKELIDVDLDRPRTREHVDARRVEALEERVWDVLSDEVEQSIERER